MEDYVYEDFVGQYAPEGNEIYGDSAETYSFPEGE
jgi:hypothetical protein